MEQNKKKLSPLQANRILYLSVIGVLCLAAIIIGIAAALSGGESTPTVVIPETERESQSESEQQSPPVASTPPALIAPVAGNVYAEHDLSVLVFSNTMGDWRVHAGIDIAASVGTDVLAAADGVIDSVWEDPLMGTCVSISHTGDLKTVYKNLAVTLPSGVVEGASVKQGAVIGSVGETALIECADDAHLHMEVSLKDELVDPLDYIAEASKNASLTFGEDTLYEG